MITLVYLHYLNIIKTLHDFDPKYNLSQLHGLKS